MVIFLKIKTILSTLVLGSMLIAGSVSADTPSGSYWGDSYYDANNHLANLYSKFYTTTKLQADAYANLSDVLTSLASDDYPNSILTTSEISNGLLFPDTYDNLQQVKFWNHQYMIGLATFNDVQPTDAAYKTMEESMSNVGWSTKSKLKFVLKELDLLKKREKEYKSTYDKCTEYVINHTPDDCSS